MPTCLSSIRKIFWVEYLCDRGLTDKGAPGVQTRDNVSYRLSADVQRANCEAPERAGTESSCYDVLFQENVLNGTKFMFSRDKTRLHPELGLVRSGVGATLRHVTAETFTTPENKKTPSRRTEFSYAQSH